jgi:hypothetical protein
MEAVTVNESVVISEGKLTIETETAKTLPGQNRLKNQKRQIVRAILFILF